MNGRTVWEEPPDNQGRPQFSFRCHCGYSTIVAVIGGTIGQEFATTCDYCLCPHWFRWHSRLPIKVRT